MIPRANSHVASRQRGFALLLTLWSMALLALLGAQVAGSARAGLKLAANDRAAAQAEAAADAAVQEAILHAAEGSWPADGLVRRLRIGDTRVDMSMLDHAGRLNPNRMSQDQLASLLHAVGLARDPASQLASEMTWWRDRAGETGPGTPEAERYGAAGLDYLPAHRPFRSMSEIALVLGMSPDILARLAPHISLHNEGGIDLTLADPIDRAVLQETGQLHDAEANFLHLPMRVIEVTATAILQGGGRFTRHGIIRLSRIDRASPQPWTVLAWDTQPAP